MYRLLAELPRLLLLLLLLLVAAHPLAAEPAGYHYDRPSAGHYAPTAPSAIVTGHHFSPLPTVQPLPPVPALPPLPRTRIQQPSLSLASRYLPPTPTAPVVSRYQAPAYAAPLSSITFHGNAHAKVQAPSAPAAAQPLRIPFGKTALFSPGESYVANGRQLKQYAVIEIIDNDISDSPAPFLNSGFLDQYRASVGASGTSATPTSTGVGFQLDSRANALVLEQQALSLQPRANQGDAIALGSGGLGYIRLPNGNVYLGSGSLGYISGQQRVASVLDARTRSESTSDALHFGHGPYGGADNFLRF
ncbi:PREDICTED: uncharacterized protein LOC108609607 [Drosophila arizonae]|uniref:Uncharacterized protein LOC108609607 n=1 Tax=Drosophila arizonae TaxID=7263 RepID=A0ABM1NPD0_DROAR|nr:PREDICTED: uncharacterized protein LOC108609607 [Drosophila arizonae]